MTHPDDIPTRVTRLEQQMVEARSNAAAARLLAGGADHDVSQMQEELRAHTRTLNALRETQVEQGKEMREGFQKVDERFQKVDGEFRRIDGQFLRVDGEFSKIHTGIAHITALLTDKSGDG